MGVAPLGTTQVFLLSSFRLGLAQIAKPVSTKASALWTPVTPPSAAAFNRYRHCLQTLPLLPLLFAATTAASGRCCRQLPPLLTATAAYVGRSRRHCRTIPPLLPGSHRCPPLSLTAAAAAAAAAVIRYRCRLRPLPLPVTAAVDCRLRRPTPLSAAVADTASRIPTLPTMVDLPPLRPPRSVAEALGTGAIRAKLSAILAAHSQTVFKDGTDLTLEKRSGQGIHSFLVPLASGVDPVPGL